jgi:hypothetical protein
MHRQKQLTSFQDTPFLWVGRDGWRRAEVVGTWATLPPTQLAVVLPTHCTQLSLCLRPSPGHLLHRSPARAPGFPGLSFGPL